MTSAQKNTKQPVLARRNTFQKMLDLEKKIKVRNLSKEAKSCHLGGPGDSQLTRTYRSIVIPPYLRVHRPCLVCSQVPRSKDSIHVQKDILLC